MPKLAECDPLALAVVMAECERLIGAERFDDIALSHEMDSTKQYGAFMYHAGQRTLLDKLRSAIRKQEHTHGLPSS